MHQHSVHCSHNHSDKTINPKTKQTQLTIALVLIITFAIAELVAGLTSHSLALVAESGHMAADSFALLLALLATWVSQWSKSNLGENPRLEVGAALINGVALAAIAGWIAWEAIAHLHTPSTEIASLPMLLTACIGAVVNGINVALLHQGSDHDLNLRGAFLHVLADTISSIGVIVAAIAIAVLHWFWADSAISLFVAGLILLSALPLLTESTKSLFWNR